MEFAIHSHGGSMVFAEWAVQKSTTDKLEGDLNAVSAAHREVEQIQYIGGRDWVVVSCREVDELPRRSHGGN